MQAGAELSGAIPAPPAKRPAGGGRGRNREQREATLAFWVLVGPMVLGLGLFTVVPIVWGFLISLNDSQNTVSVGTWVGLRNYADMLRDAAFRDALWTIVLFTLFIVPLTYALALLLAVLVNAVPVGKAFFRTTFFIPTAISYVIASMIWRMSLFNGLPSGAANMALYEWFGIEQPVNWINSTNPPWFWLVLVSVRLWLQVGFYMILFLAALQEIPRDLYEAAYVDGGRAGWRTFRDITLPLLRNTSIAVLLLLLVNAFMAFDEFYNIMGGTAASQGNRALARPPLVYLYQVGLQDADYGHAAAGAFILTGLIVMATLLQGRITGFGRKA